MSKKSYEKTKIMLKGLLSELGYTFNNTLDKSYKPYTPSKEQYKKVWDYLDLNQNCNKYRWEGLPKGLTSWNLERMLYYYGALCGFKYGGQIWILPFTATQDLNAYGFPTTIQPITFNGRTPDNSSKDFFGADFKVEMFMPEETPDDKKAVILLDSIPEACGTFIPLSRYAQNTILINDIIETLKRININIVVSNKKLIINCTDENQAEVIRQELGEGFSSDSPFIVCTNPTSLPNISQTSDLQASDLFNVVKQYDSIRCQQSGILTKSFGQDKKERVNSGELMGEKEQVNIIYDVGLYLRQIFAKDMNRCLGTSIYCHENKEAREDESDYEDEEIIEEVQENE